MSALRCGCLVSGHGALLLGRRRGTMLMKDNVSPVQGPAGCRNTTHPHRVVPQWVSDPAEVSCRSVTSGGGERLRLDLVELRLGDRTRVEQCLRRGDLIRRARSRGASGDRLDVLGLLLLPLPLLVEGALRHAVAAGDQI